MRHALPDDAIDRKFYGSGPFRLSHHPLGTASDANPSPNGSLMPLTVGLLLKRRIQFQKNGPFRSCGRMRQSR